MPINPEICPCGSHHPYHLCCGPIHQHQNAGDARTLMRSRYSAYVLELSEYLLNTWHPATRPSDLSFDSTTQWLGLDIRHAEQLNDTQARVEFVAKYKVNGRAHRLHEISQFECIEGVWFYREGVFRNG